MALAEIARRPGTEERGGALCAAKGLPFAEFFAGIGLMRLGLERQGFRCAFANDIDPDKETIYRQNFAADDFRLGDIHALAAADLPDCRLFTASFPCNDLSVAGARGGLNVGQSSAFWGLVRLLDELAARRPPLVLLENVPGFLQSRGGQDFAAAIAALNDLGYACDVLLADAAWFVPQSRLRLFVVGWLDAPPQPTFGLQPSAARSATLVRFIHAHPELRWHLLPSPSPPQRHIALEEVLEDLPPEHPAWWNAERTDYFLNQLSPRHQEWAAGMREADSPRFATAFRRVRKGRSMAELRADGLAGCLRTPRGGSGRQILFQAGAGRCQVRLLTPRECARLQGAPDDYRVEVSLNRALFGFGDAVCVPVIEWIARHALWPRVAAGR